MKILFVVGYQKTPYSPNTWLENGLGGSEYAVMKLAETMATSGDEVTVTGEVISGTYNGVRYLNYSDLVVGDHYDVVIGVNYIHYILKLDSREITFDKSYFWVHNNEYYPYYLGEVLDNLGSEYIENTRLNKVVAVSEYSSKILSHNFPKMKDKITNIPNAIDPLDWDRIDTQNKIKDRFIYSSAADRGLQNLLDMWPDIKKIKPNATLLVATPPYGLEWYENYKTELDGVEFVGALPPSRLYDEIGKSEYWVYPSYYDETFCITALEMMMGGVKIISSDTANLKNLLMGKAKLVSSSLEFSQMKSQLLECIKNSDKELDFWSVTLKNAKEYAENLNWERISKMWKTLFDETEAESLRNVLHPELYSFKEDEIKWLERFVTYDARIREWELIADEPFDGCFNFPLFTPEFCRMIREEAEYSNKWTTNRHEYYPTTDMLLTELGLDEIYYTVLQRYVFPFAIYKFGLDGNGWPEMSSENFLARYNTTAQGHLSIHHDASDITCLVQLSDLDEYEGGGTWFWRQKKLIKAPIGYCSIHPGNITHKHGARPVSKGQRYIIVSFMKNMKR